MILNPYNFVPVTAPIKLEITYSNELESKSSKELSLMVLKDKFTIQEIYLDTKDISYNINSKEPETYLNNECKLHPSNNNCKIFCD